MKSSLKLRKVDEENWRCGLKVAENQKPFVADSAVLLASAYAYRNSRSRAFIIYEGETPVGMALYYDCDELSAYDFSQLFIDERYQGRGLGLAAAKKSSTLCAGTENTKKSSSATSRATPPQKISMKSWAFPKRTGTATK